jgi:hypothetical protein
MMDKAGRYHLYWSFDNNTITFEIIANTMGYVGLGWSPKGGMAYGDIIVGWIDHTPNLKVSLYTCQCADPGTVQADSGTLQAAPSPLLAKQKVFAGN